MSEVAELPQPITTSRPSSQNAKTPQTEKQFFRTEDKNILDKSQNKSYVQEKVDQNPENFSPLNEQILSVLDRTEKPSPIIEIQPSVDTNHTEDLKLVSEITSVLAETDQKRLIQKITESTQQLSRDMTELTKNPARLASLGRKLAFRLSPLIIAAAALMTREAEAKPQHELPVPEPAFPTVPRISEVSENPVKVEPEFVDYTVEPGDSISSILAKMHPEKYLNTDGSFKTDLITQGELYDSVDKVLTKNKELLKDQNSPLFAEIDSFQSTNNRAPQGLEIKDLAQKTGGPSEVVIIQPGQVLSIPK